MGIDIIYSEIGYIGTSILISFILDPLYMELRTCTYKCKKGWNAETMLRETIRDGRNI